VKTLRKKIRAFLVLSVLFAGSGLLAQTIHDIKFEQKSSYKFPEEMLFFNLQSKVGNKFDEKILNDDIKRLYATGFFSDIVSETTKVPGNRINIVIKVTPKDRIKDIIFRGNKKFPTEDLKKHISLVKDVPLNDRKLRESANKLREYFTSEGYNEATVTPKVEKDGEGYVKVIFIIKENLKLKVDDVLFIGNTVYSSWDLRHSLATRYSYLSWVPFLNSGLFSRSELEKDRLRLRELYWNKGYLDFKVENIKVQEQKDDPEWVNITFKLFEGKPYKVNRIIITGNKKFDEKKLLSLLALKSGEIYDNRLERQDIANITDQYAAYGYCDFVCRPIRIPDYKTHEVDIEYRITEGKPYTVNDINISGNKVTKDKVIRRELAIEPGDPVDKNLIKASKSRLMGMGYFESVEAVDVNAAGDSMKDVNFMVKEKNTAKFKVGGGWSDTDSLMGMVELSQSNFDITDPYNYFQGGGQRVMAQAFFGLERYNFNVNFTEPWLFDIPLKLDVSGFLRNMDYKNWSEQRLGFDVALTKKVIDDFTSVRLGYTFEQVKVYGMDRDMPQDLKDEEETDLVGTMSLNITRDTRDSYTEPTSGYFLSGLSELTWQGFGAKYNYVRLEGKASQYFSLLDKALIFHLGSKIGSIHTLGGTSKVPLYERYFLGGGDSVRGFPYREISPLASDDKTPMGGQSMLLLTAEMTHPIWKFVRGAIFADAGNVWSGTGPSQLGRINIGAGYGLRIKLPYLNAPIKLDLAYPVYNNQDGVSSKFRFHFNMGFSW
jgi:outer membrane protein insertion porin family